MVSIAQVQQGVVRFVDTEIVPRLSVTERLVVGGGMGLVAAKLPELIKQYENTPFVAALGLYDQEHEEVDLDALYNAVKPYIGADPIPVTVPFVGLKLKFTQREIDTLYKYIKEA